MLETILAVLLSLPAYFEDGESLAERAARMRPVAEDITSEAERQHYFEPIVAAAVIIRIGYEETRFARYVGKGRCREGRWKCDPDKYGNPQSLTYYQLKRRACPKAHELVDGSRAQHRAAVRCALRRYAGAYYRCKSGHIGAFSGYRSAACEWPVARGRAHRLRGTLARLRARSGARSGTDRK